MKLPQILKQAILNSDWQLVCSVYTAITGEPIQPPQLQTEEEILADMNINMPINPVVHITKSEELKNTYYDGNLTTEQQQPQPDVIVQESPIKTRNGPVNLSATQANFKNKFIDDGTLEKQDLKENNPVLNTIYSKSKRSDRRPPSEFVNATCCVCGQTNSVSAVLVAGRCLDPSKDSELPLYKCDRCIKAK